MEAVSKEFPKDIFESLIGGVYDFYGVDNHAFCIGVDGSRLILEAVDDPSDGYRSYFGCFVFDDTNVSPIFFGTPIARVRLLEGGRSRRTPCFCDGNDPYDDGRTDHPCENHAASQRTNFSGWVLRDVDTDHEWLTVGTDHGEDYYPCFTFIYQPDPTKKVDNA